MLRGVLNPDETGSLMLVREIVRLVTDESQGDGQRLCFSVPAAWLGADAEVNAHESAKGHVVQARATTPAASPRAGCGLR